MSKHNKANKSNYIQAGRLTADELAREQQKQRQVTTPDPGMNDRDDPRGHVPEGGRPEGAQEK